MAPLYAPTSTRTPQSFFCGKTLIGEQWEQRMDKITLAKTGEFTLGFVLPDEARAEMVVQKARDMYPPGRPCHLTKAAVLMLFSQQRNVGEYTSEVLMAVLNVDFAVAPSQPAPAVSKTSALTFGPVVERVIMPYDKNPAQACLDLGSGEFRSPPADMDDDLPPNGRRVMVDFEGGLRLSDLKDSEAKRYDWLKTSGVDVIGGRGFDGRAKFKIIGQPPHYENGWASFDSADPERVVQTLQASPFAAGDKPNLPSVYINVINPQLASVKNARFILFRTHDGDAGILQVLGESWNPPGVKIRYKLVQMTTTTVAPLSMPPAPAPAAPSPDAALEDIKQKVARQQLEKVLDEWLAAQSKLQDMLTIYKPDHPKVMAQLMNVQDLEKRFVQAKAAIP